MNLRSPLSKVSRLGAAGEGVGHWWAQRISAIALIPLSIWFVVSLLNLPLQSYEAVRGWLSQPWVAVLTLLLVFTVAWHSKLGVQVVIEDYAAGKGTKTTLMLINLFVHVIAGVAGILAILRMTLA